MTLMNCDPATGSCRIPDAAPILPQGAKQAPGGEVTLRYIGDPMCSWCWGISSTLEELARYCEQKGIGFTLTMGGLRAGGGDAWGPEFREFLRREWTHIAKVTGQPFGFSLLSAKHFDYDTEPACRAVVVAEQMLDQKRPVASATLAFFSAVQRKFYVEGEDPKNVDFYRSICEDASLSFEDFRAHFATAAARQAVYRQFAQCGEWGVRAFPTLLLGHHSGKRDRTDRTSAGRAHRLNIRAGEAGGAMHGPPTAFCGQGSPSSLQQSPLPPGAVHPCRCDNASAKAPARLSALRNPGPGTIAK